MASLQQQSQRDLLILRDVHGTEHAIPLTEIVDSWKPNAMTLTGKTLHFLHQLWRFVSDSPAEGESESGRPGDLWHRADGAADVGGRDAAGCHRRHLAA